VTRHESSEPDVATEATEPGILGTVLVVVAVLTEMWLRGRFMVVTVCLSLAAMVAALSAQQAVWAVIAVLPIAGAATAFFGPLLRPWHPSRTWLIMLTTSAFDLGVILVLAPP
jgi:hypothetical protein